MPHVVLDFQAPTSPADPHRSGAPRSRPPTHRRARFRDPLEVVTAHDLAGVRAAIRRVQEAAADGLHAAGYIAYEAAPAFEPAMRVRAGNRLPLVWFGIFRAPEILPPGAAVRAGSAAAVDGSAAASADVPVVAADAPSAWLSVAPEPDWRLEWGPEEHAAAVGAVREAIAAGRTYQVNLTTRMRGRLAADPWAFYERMRRSQGSGYHAFLDVGRQVVLSASPELFFETRGRDIVTRPMKGTRPRGRWPEEDRALAEALRSSEKDRAENLMIVDLLRNDLGRVCDTGSIRAAGLHEIERYRTVWQMTSTVRGRLRHDVDLLTTLDALFPCGSVTGAPKISTMNEIARLEASPREVYCGAIGWVRPGGDATFSVPIRTAWVDRDSGAIEYGTGGGVVWDSTTHGEYDELRAKAVVIREPWPEFSLLETLALRDGLFVRLDRHLARMRDSADYFGFTFPPGHIAAALTRLAESRPAGAFRARLILDDDGTVAAHATPLDPPGDDIPVVAHAADPVDSGNPFLFHKTTHREMYTRRSADLPHGVFDAILHNERGEVTELTRGNLVAEIDGERVTPARASGLLAGCLRQELIEDGAITERVITLRELERATRVWFINSTRGWIEVRVE